MLNNPLIANSIFIFGHYCLFVYWPIRLVGGFFMTGTFDRCLASSFRVYGPSTVVPTIVGVLCLMKYMNVGKVYYKNLNEMPRWLEIVSLVIALSEIGFLFLLSFIWYFKPTY